MTLTPDEIARAEELQHSGDGLQIEYIRELLVSTKWTPANKRRLAAIWGVAGRVLADKARAARASLLASVQDPEELRQLLIEKCHYVVSDAMQKKKPFLDRNGEVQLAPDPDHRSALSGIKLIAEMAGVADGTQAPASRKQYEDANLSELLAAAEKKLLPQKPLQLEVVGEEVEEEEVEI